MKLKSLVLNGLVVIVAITASAAAMEFGTRMLFPALAPSGQLRFVAGEGEIPALGPRNTYLRQIKNTGDFDVAVNFNKYGFRDAKDLATSTLDDYFIVGDSLSFGWGVEENARYSNLVQEPLGRKVFNLCIPGDINDFERAINYAISNGARVNNLFLAISMAFGLKNYENPGKVPLGAANQVGIIAQLKPYLMTHSAFYFLVTSIIHKNETLKNIAVDFGVITPAVEGIAHKPYSETTIDSTARRAQRLAKRFNTIIVIAPSRALWFGTAKEKETADRIHWAFIARLRELGLAVADVRPAFEEGGNPVENYFANDGHWSPTGHAAAARAILRYLKTHNKPATAAKSN